MSAASEADLAALHSELARTFKEILVEGEKEVTKDGDVVSVSPKPATLNAIRQFLKDNGIEAQRSPDKDTSFDRLVSTLPTFDDIEEHP